MRTSEHIDQFATAFSQAQGEFPAVEKRKKNPRFASKHSDIDAVLAAALPILSKFGLALTQPLSNSPSGGVNILTRLMHKSGQYQEEDFTLIPDQKGPQGMGSVITYGRRYCAKSMLGLADEDDDAEAASIMIPQGNGEAAAASDVSSPPAFPTNEKAAKTGQTSFPVGVPNKPSADAKPPLGARIPKMLDAFKTNLNMDAVAVEALLCKPLDKLDENDFKILERDYKDLESKKRQASDLDAFKDLNTASQQMH